MESERFYLEFTGDKEFINEIKKYANRFQDEIVLKDSEYASKNLDLDLTDYASIVTIITGIGTLIGFARCIYIHLKNDNNKIIVKTPLETIEIHSKDALSEDQIKEKLKKIAEF